MEYPHRCSPRLRLREVCEPVRRAVADGRAHRGLDWFWAAAAAVELPVTVYGPGLSGPLAAARRFPACGRWWTT
ncbi:hypothetical protein [Saccharothrix longispora]|uniref:hypothetical protein n=1 Tax=Saccharothrix longispora TaxID=33920 RepID=UPI0028FD396E|nr:hypothetical protein [Saccharothrix longispora]MDU0288170.1 hypothetical protein [Saccharothrix longispora]